MSSLLEIRAPIVPPPSPELGSSQRVPPGVGDPPVPTPPFEFQSRPELLLPPDPVPPPHAGRARTASRLSARKRPARTALRFIESPPGREKEKRLALEWKLGSRGGGPRTIVEVAASPSPRLRLDPGKWLPRSVDAR